MTFDVEHADYSIVGNLHLALRVSFFLGCLIKKKVSKLIKLLTLLENECILLLDDKNVVSQILPGIWICRCAYYFEIGGGVY